MIRVKPKPVPKARQAEARDLNLTGKQPRPTRVTDRHLRDDPGAHTAFVRKDEIFITRQLGRITQRTKIGEVTPTGSLLYISASGLSLDLRKLPQPIKRQNRKQASGPMKPLSAKERAKHGEVQEFLRDGIIVQEQEVSLPPARAVSGAPSRMSATDAETGAVLGLLTQRTGPA